MSTIQNIEPICKDKDLLREVLEEIFYQIGRYFIGRSEQKWEEDMKLVMKVSNEFINKIIENKNTKKKDVEKWVITSNELKKIKDSPKNDGFNWWTLLGEHAGRNEINKMDKIVDMIYNSVFKQFTYNLNRLNNFNDIERHFSVNLETLLENLAKEKILGKHGLYFQVLTYWFTLANPEFVAPLSLAPLVNKTKLNYFKVIIEECFYYSDIYTKRYTKRKRRSARPRIRLDSVEGREALRLYYEVYLYAINRAKERLRREFGNQNITSVLLFYFITKYSCDKECGKLIEQSVYRWIEKIGPQKQDYISKFYDNCKEIQIDLLKHLLLKYKQIILFGPPGTGKTYLAKCLAQGYYSKFVTFHKSYSYEEFVEGIWPTNIQERIHYTVKDGIFKKLAIMATYTALYPNHILKELEAMYDEVKEKVIEYLEKIADGEIPSVRPDFEKAPPFYLIIDEINRGDISRILGELITLLEPDKRLTGDNQIIVRLPYSEEPFAVPPNLYIIGTMNSTDRSIALVDIALRRRFAFFELRPQPDLININIEGISLSKLLKKLNSEIRQRQDSDFEIGHSYFLNINDAEDLRFTWYYQIIPLLREYFYPDYERIFKEMFGNTEKLYNVEYGSKIGEKEFLKLLREWLGD
ncbi:MAG: AAA family ATPase [Desulfurococcales archaeon]|nr:AAA family ATPase [Desulfurococcales archaeon]